MGQTHRNGGFCFGVCDRCGNDFKRIARGQPYKYCSHSCSITPVEERFLNAVCKTDGCWLWTGKKNPDGYGELQIDGKIIKAHRLSYELHIGLIPDGFEVCHTCDTPNCINPDHLFAGTHSDNMKDMVSKGRNFIPDVKGEFHGASKLTEQQVIHIRECPGPQRKTAALFGVSQSLVSMIKNKIVWSHI